MDEIYRSHETYDRLLSVAKDVGNGSSFDEAMSRHPEKEYSSPRDKIIAEAKAKKEDKTTPKATVKGTEQKTGNLLWDAVKSAGKNNDPSLGWETDELSAANIRQGKAAALNRDDTVFAQMVRDRRAADEARAAEEAKKRAEAKETEKAIRNLQKTYNSQKRELENAQKTLGNLKSGQNEDYSGWAVDELTAKNMSGAGGNSEAVKAAEKRLKDAQTAIEFTRQEMQDLGGRAEDAGFLERAGKVITGTAKNIAGAGVNAAGTVIAQDAARRDFLIEEEAPQAQKDYDRAKADYEDAVAEFGEDSADARFAANILAEAEKKLKEEDVFIGGGTSDRTTADRLEATAGRLFASGANDLSDAKRNASVAGQIAADIGSQALMLGGDALLNVIAPGMGTAAMLTRNFGNATYTARQAGAGENQQVLYGLASSALEALTEKMFDGVAGIYGKGAADDVVEKVIAEMCGTDRGRTMLRTLANMGGEGAEEYVSARLEPVLQMIYDPDALNKAYGTGEAYTDTVVNALYDAAIGMALGGFGSAVELANGQNAAKNAALRGYTAENALPDAGSMLNAEFGIRNAEEEVTSTATTDMTTDTSTASTETPTAGKTIEERRADLNARFTKTQQSFEEEYNRANGDTRKEQEIMRRYDEAMDAFNREDAALRAEETQQRRIESGEVSKQFGTDENHISRRDNQSAAKPSVKAFQFDHPELHEYFVAAAKELQQQVFNATGNITVSKMTGNHGKISLSGNPLESLYNQMSLPEINKCLEDIIANNGQENYANAKRVELVLDKMMVDGWSGADRVYHAPVDGYKAARDAINGGAKTDSYEQYVQDNSLSLATGEVTEEELRKEWEAKQVTGKLENAPVEPVSSASETKTKEAGQVKSAPAEEPKIEKTKTGNMLYDGIREDVARAAEKVSQETPKKAAESAQKAEGTSVPSDSGNGGTGVETTVNSAEGDGAVKERGYSENIRTDAAMEDAIRAEYESDPDFYKQKSNKATLDKASEIMRQGVDKAETAIREALAKAQAGEKLPLEMIPLSKMVANELTRQGRVDAAREIISGIGAELTEYGQIAQAARILRNADPLTKQEVIFKLVDKLNKALTKGQRKNNAKNQRGDSSGNIKVNNDLITEFANAETEEARNKAIDKITKDIAKQIPSTFGERFTALRYVNMLGNLKTQVRNVGGNVLMGTTAWAKRKVQAATELTASFLSSGKYERNTALAVSPKLFKEAMSDIANVKDTLQGEAKYSDSGKGIAKAVQDERQIFRLKGMEFYRKATKALMEGGDTPFLNVQYASALAGWMKAHGVKSIADATPEQLEKGRAFAIKEAQEATFHDSNELSDWVSKLGRTSGTPKAINALLEGIIPFRKTPANVAIRAVEYSPVGAALTIYNGVQAIKGNESGADVINSLSKTVTGSALAYAGYLMAMAGKARTKDRDEKAEEYAKMTGALDYSVNIAGKDVSLSQFAPTSIPFFIGVGIYEAIQNSEDFSFDVVKDVATAITDPLIQQSMLSGVNEALQLAASGDGEAAINVFGNAMLSYALQGVQNSLAGQIAQAKYENRQTTYTLKDNPLSKEVQYKLSTAAMKDPFGLLPKQNQDYIDAWGRKQSQGSTKERYFNNLLNPTYYSQSEPTPIDGELNRLHNSLKDTEGYTSVYPQKGSRGIKFGDGQTMTPEEYQQYSIERGQKSYKLVSDFIESSQYKTLTDAEKANVIRDLYSFSADLALDKVKNSYGVEKSKNYEFESKLKDPVSFFTADVQISSDYEAKGEEKPSQGRELFENYLYYGIKGKDADALAKKNLGKKNLGAYTVMRDNNKRPQDIMEMLDAWDIIKSDGKIQDKPDGKYNQASVYKGLSGLNIPDSDKSKIWNALLDNPETQYSDYRAKQKR